jgi:hypothetical protein
MQSAARSTICKTRAGVTHDPSNQQPFAAMDDSDGCETGLALVARLAGTGSKNISSSLNTAALISAYRIRLDTHRILLDTATATGDLLVTGASSRRPCADPCL